MKILLDTSVLIEYIKGNKTKLLENLLLEEKSKLYINDIIYSKFMFHFISVVSGKSPFTLKTKKEISKLLSNYEPLHFLENFEVLFVDEKIIKKSYEYMKKYNLLPNDSLILATYKVKNLNALASFDSDFIDIAGKEKINLFTE